MAWPDCAPPASSSIASKLLSSLPGSTRQSIPLKESYEDRWMRGSSPRMANFDGIFLKSASFCEADFFVFEHSFAPLTFINHIETIP
jgi:hypothetical protein